MNPLKNPTSALISCIGRLERHRRTFINSNLKDPKLRGSMFLALIFLNHNPGTSQDQLCNHLLMDKGNTARLCRSLEEMGYITREQSSVDRRQNMLYLSKKGEEELPSIFALMKEWRDTATSGMTDEEIETVVSLLTRMLENIEGK